MVGGSQTGNQPLLAGLLFVCHDLHVAIASPNYKPWLGVCFLASCSTIHESQIGFADVGLVVRTAVGSSAIACRGDPARSALIACARRRVRPAQLTEERTESPNSARETRKKRKL